MSPHHPRASLKPHKPNHSRVAEEVKIALRNAFEAPKRKRAVTGTESVDDLTRRMLLKGLPSGRTFASGRANARAYDVQPLPGVRHQKLYTLVGSAQRYTPAGTLRPGDLVLIGMDQFSVLGKQNLGPGQMALVVETADGQNFIEMSRDALIPIVRLADEFGRDKARAAVGNS